MGTQTYFTDHYVTNNHKMLLTFPTAFNGAAIISLAHCMLNDHEQKGGEKM